MPRRRDGTEFPWRFLRRSVRPFHLAVAIGMVVIGVNNLFTEETPLSTTGWGDFVGTVAFVAAIGLFLSWLERWGRLAEDMLVVAAGVWAYRATLYLLEGAQGHFTIWVTSFGLSVAWLVGTAGAYLLERYDRAERGGDE